MRLPASYCGVIGLRTTHGRIPLSGAVPLAPSYDTVGWFARNPVLFEQVGLVLFGTQADDSAPGKVLLARDLFGAAGAEVTEALESAVAKVAGIYGPLDEIEVVGAALPSWRNAFRLIQSDEAWAAHGDWIRTTNPSFGPGVKERFAAAAELDRAEVSAARDLRGAVRRRMDEILGASNLLVLPTAPGIAPLLNTPFAELEAFRARALELLCAAGHAGLPQISVPLAALNGCPLGLSVIAPRGRDEMLLALARKIADATPARG